ncbi:MAG: MFS transporter [Chloroflexi bacterium]|nr:MFS transporter [Chloroflexota bacterium]
MMIATLRNRNFSLLWTAGLISLIGNWMLIAALPFYIYEVTGSALATSGWLIAYILPGILFGSVAGVFVDRWDRRKTMMGVSLLQAAVIPLLLLVQSPEMIWIVYVVGFIESTLSYFFMPAESALLPTLVGEEHLLSANSLNSLNDNLARITGPAIGGVLLGLFGLNSVILADAVSYVLAGLLISLILVPTGVKTAAAQEVAQTAKAKFMQVWQELAAGLKVIKHSRILAGAFIVVGIALFGDAIMSAVMVVFAQEVMELGADEFGWILAARGMGGLLGGLLVAQLGQRFSTTQLVAGGLILSGFIVLIIVNIPTMYVAIPLMIVAGIPLIAWIVSLQTIFQQATTDEYRGRVFGAFGTVSALLMAVGAMMAGGITDVVGSAILMSVASLIYVFSGLLGWVLLRKPVEQLDLMVTKAEASS